MISSGLDILWEGECESQTLPKMVQVSGSPVEVAASDFGSSIVAEIRDVD